MTGGEPVVRVGFVPLTDSAPLIVAAALQFDRRHGIRLSLARETSWAAIRDKLFVGTLDAAQMLYGLAYGMHLGIGMPATAMCVAMTLNRNGQAITLSRRLAAAGVTDGASLAAHLRDGDVRLRFADTFPLGTHALWLDYWLAAQGIHPYRDVGRVTVPPPHMAARLAAGDIDGYSAGEPWPARAVADGCGYTVTTSQAIWPDHPEKVLGMTRRYARTRPEDAIALIAAVLDAARWLETEASPRELARLLARAEYVGGAATLIAARLAGRYRDGLGASWQDAHAVRFFDRGRVCFPYLSDATWFLTQFVRWGRLAPDVDYAAIVAGVNDLALYGAAAARCAVPLPAQPWRSAVLCDGRAWDGSEPARYARGFALAQSGEIAPA